MTPPPELADDDQLDSAAMNAAFAHDLLALVAPLGRHLDTSLTAATTPISEYSVRGEAVLDAHRAVAEARRTTRSSVRSMIPDLEATIAARRRARLPPDRLRLLARGAGAALLPLA